MATPNKEPKPSREEILEAKKAAKAVRDLAKLANSRGALISYQGPDQLVVYGSANLSR